jgi:ElaB/YqjD/DUF883 family membrane-anchored ribosome-binding protein
MARSYEEFHEQNKGKLKEEFNTKSTSAPDAAVADKKQTRLERENHIQKRIQEKMQQITEERSAPQPTPDFAARPDLNLDSIHREAINRVQSETVEEKKEWTKEMAENTVEPQTQDAQDQDNDIEQSKAIEEEANQESEKPEKAFKAKIHQIVDESQKRRSEASRTFIKNRKELLVQAEELGADNPAREVATAQREVHKTINENEHKQLHALFQEHGWDYEKQGIQFVESEANAYSNTQENSQEQVNQQTYTQVEEQ